jgi:nucleoside-diphosphate-sugar epimerase
MATMLRPLLARDGRTLRLIDRAPIPTLTGVGDEEHITAALEDKEAIRRACVGVDAILHLGGLSLEAPWEDIMSVNIDGTHTVLEAARTADVPRVILASTNHVAGFLPVTDAPLPDLVTPAPDTYYAVSKLALEALGSLFHHRYGLDVVVIRIGSCFEQPQTRRMLSTWLSPGDAARLVEAALAEREPGFRTVWGQSANTRGVFSLDSARALGYVPEDDAEDYATTLDAEGPGAYDSLIGGQFCAPDLDAPLPDRTGDRA